MHRVGCDLSSPQCAYVNLDVALPCAKLIQTLLFVDINLKCFEAKQEIEETTLHPIGYHGQIHHLNALWNNLIFGRCEIVMVNSGSFGCEENGNRKASCVQTSSFPSETHQSSSPITATSATTNDFLPCKADAVEPTPSKTDLDGSTMTVVNNNSYNNNNNNSSSKQTMMETDKTKRSFFCSVPLEKVQTVLSTYKVSRKVLCLYCDRTFVNANLRQKHVERCHSAKQLRRVSLRKHQNCLTSTPCIHCDTYTSTTHTLKELFEHLNLAHSNKYFGCLSCEERYLNSTHLADHNALYHRKVEVVAELPRPETDPKPNPKGMRAKKLAVKSSRMIIKRSKRLQAKLTEAQPSKRRDKKPGDKVAKMSSSAVNPYPEFDNYFQVKKITDHSIDNLKIGSLTFDDVFDKAFFNRIACNIQENLLHHIDGKLFENEESESRISNFEKVSATPQEVQSANAENYGCELSLNAIAPTTLLLSSQFGEDPESQIEYGSKPSKKKTQTKKDEVHYKYFTRRKYQASILEHKENRDLSKLDMWTQYVIKNRQQKVLDDKKSPKEILDYFSGEEYKNLMKREELNRILDRRGPFEDLREEVSKKAAMEKMNGDTETCISDDSLIEVGELLNDILNKVFELTKETSRVHNCPIKQHHHQQQQQHEEDVPEIPSYLNLRRTTSLPGDAEIDRSDKIALICSSQETENFELPSNTVRGKNEKVELTGEWARSRIYVCAACGLKLQNIKQFLEHKSASHHYVWVQHYEFVGNQSELYRHLSIPVLGKVGVLEQLVQCKIWRRSDARMCSKCGKQCNSLGELHRHILECGGDWTWMLVRKKYKYRPFGAKSRRKRRGLVKRIYTQKTEPSEKKIYKKTYDIPPRQKASDADTIQRMLANLPAKRATRKIICLKDGFNNTRNNNNQVKTPRKSKFKCGKLIRGGKNNAANNKYKKTNNKKQQNSSYRRSLRCLNKVLTSRILDTNSTLIARRKYKKKIAQQVQVEEVAAKQVVKAKSNIEVEEKAKTPKRCSPRIEKRLEFNGVHKSLTDKMSIKRFFPVTKKKNFKQVEDGEKKAKEEKSEIGLRKRKLDSKNSSSSVKPKVKKKVPKKSAPKKRNSKKVAVETDPFLEKTDPEPPKLELMVPSIEEIDKDEDLKPPDIVKIEEVPCLKEETVVVSPPPQLEKVKKKTRKPLNDCIAMLTNKLTKNIEDSTKTNIFTAIAPVQENVEKPDEFILKVPLFNEHFDLHQKKEPEQVPLNETFCSSTLKDKNIEDNIILDKNENKFDQDEISTAKTRKKATKKSRNNKAAISESFENEIVSNKNSNKKRNQTIFNLPEPELVPEKSTEEHNICENVPVQQKSDSEDEIPLATFVKESNCVEEEIENLEEISKVQDLTENGQEVKDLHDVYEFNVCEEAENAKSDKEENVENVKNDKEENVDESAKECEVAPNSNLNLVSIDEETPNENEDKSEEGAKEEEKPRTVTDALQELTESHRNTNNFENILAKNALDELNKKDITDQENDLNLIINNKEEAANDNAADNGKELRRSKRKAKKMNSYNEIDLVDPLLDEFNASKNITKIIAETAKNIFLEKPKSRRSSSSHKKAKNEVKLSGDELFDLLKATPSENIVLTKPANNSFLNNFDELSDDFNDDNFDVLEDILEKSIAVIEENLAEEIPAIKKNSKSGGKKKISKSSKHRKNQQKLLGEEIENKLNLLESEESFAENSNSRSSDKNKTNYCEICDKFFCRVEGLTKHKRTLTHISKLSEIEAKEAALKAKEEEERKDLNLLDILETIETSDCKRLTPSPFSVDVSNTNLKLADIISDVLNKPVLKKSLEEHNFANIIEEQHEIKHLNLAQRKSFDSDSSLKRSTDYYEPEIANAAGTILEKQITLLENIIENRSSLSYVEDLTVSSTQSDNENISTNIGLTLNYPTNPIKDEESFLKPSQYEEISEDSNLIRSYDEQKARKVLNRDEELFLECCSLLKSGSEVSNYSKADVKTKPQWMENKESLEPVSDASMTGAGDFSQDDSNFSTISSNWNVDSMALSEDNKQKTLSFEKVFNNGSVSSYDGEVSDAFKEKSSTEERIASNYQDIKKIENSTPTTTNVDNKKMLTKGAMKVFEGLRVSIPTEELNMDKILTCSPPLKKQISSITTTTNEEFIMKRLPLLKKQHNFVKSSKIHDIYDFEETQDNSDVFTKPDFRSFRSNYENKSNSNKKVETPTNSDYDDSQDCTDAFSSSTSSVAELPNQNKSDQNITKKKCMIMGRIFKNAAKSRIIDENIRNIPIIDNTKLVEDFVLNCPDLEKSKIISEAEMNAVFDSLTNSECNDPKQQLNETKNNKKKIKTKNKKRGYGHSDSSDDEFRLQKSPRKRVKKKNNKIDDNIINLEQELKECIGVASRKSQRKCTSGKQNVLMEYWSSDESSLEVEVDTNNTIIEQVKEPTIIAIVEENKTKFDDDEVQKSLDIKQPHKKLKLSSSSFGSNRRKRTAVNPLYHWSSSSEDESRDLIEVKPLRDEVDDDEDRPIQHGWIVGDSPKKLVTMLAQAKGKKCEVDSVKEHGKKRTNAFS